LEWQRRKKLAPVDAYHSVNRCRSHAADLPPTLQTPDAIPAELLPILRAARATLVPFVAQPERLDRAEEVAAIVGGLAQDATLIHAVMAREALVRSALDQADIAQSLGAEVVTLARELHEFGGVTLSARARGARKLEPAQAEVLRKMLLSVVSDPRLVIARIAHQLVLMRHAKTANPEQRGLWGLETREVFAPLANRLGLWQLKWELEDLAFRFLEPDDYKRIAAALAEKRVAREQYIVDLVRELTALLAAEGIAAEIYGRPKHIFSIWRKMQRKQLTFEQLFDVRAVRIVVATVPECYAALGIVHGRYPYLAGEFDDYIATPKGNFYRSIHTAVIGPQGQAVEVQIRTREMHEQAELGLAAHWRYKEGAARDVSYDRKIAWVRKLLEPAAPGSEASDRDFLEEVRAELFEDRVYALTPKGEVVDLPSGATPLDFAYQVHTNLGHRCKGARVNGRIVPLTRALANGEIVEIITGKQPAPSRDWLSPEQGFLVSPRSRAKVRAWFRKLDEGDHRAAGHAAVERELARVGVGHEMLAALVQELKAPDADRLYVLVGEGEIGAGQLTQAIERLALPARARKAPSVPRAVRAKAKRATSSPVELSGVGDLPISLARCCAPVRPQPIAGYVTLGRGVTVHRKDCAGLKRMLATHPERALPANWSAHDGALPVQIAIEAWDRRGLVRDLTEILAAAHLNIDSMQTVTDPVAGIASVSVRTGVQSLGELDQVLAKLKRVSGVTKARRTG
jgi:GTP pyrophosphokinase